MSKSLSIEVPGALDVVETVEFNNPKGTASDEQSAKDARKKHNDIKKKLTAKFIREATMYLIFIGVFCVVSYGLRTTWVYYFTESIQKHITREYKPGLTYLSLGGVNDFMDWFGNYFLPTVLTTNRKVAEFTDIIGTIRVRQVRVQPNMGCVKNRMKFIVGCNAAIQDAVSDKSPFGIALQDPLSLSDNDRVVLGAYRWRSGEDLCTGITAYCQRVTFGRRRASYDASGYAFDFNTSLDVAQSQWTSMTNNLWVDNRTRAVIVEFSGYNPSIRLILGVQLLIEFFPTGRVQMSQSIKTMPILDLVTKREVASFVGEIILMAFVFGYFIMEVQEFITYMRLKSSQCTVCCKKQILKTMEIERLTPCFCCGYRYNSFRLYQCPLCGYEADTSHKCWKGYFQDIWNYADIINQFLFIVVFILRAQLRVLMNQYDFSALAQSDKFVSFHSMGFVYSTANWVAGVNALICFIKTFKYLGRFKSLSLLVKCLAVAKTDIFYFMVIFSVIFAGYAFSFYLAFGTDLQAFRSWSESIFSLILSLLGHFDFASLYASNRILAPLLFFLYQITVYFILANMFVAILSESYVKAKELIEKGRDDSLSIALKSTMIHIKFGIATCLPSVFLHKSSYNLVMKIVEGLEFSNSLSAKELDDLRQFKHEIEVNIDDAFLFIHVAQSFNHEIPEKMDHDVYDRLHKAVRDFRRIQRKTATTKVWEDDDDEEEIQSPFPAVKSTGHKSLKTVATAVAMANKFNKPLTKSQLVEKKLEHLGTLVNSLVEIVESERRETEKK